MARPVSGPRRIDNSGTWFAVKIIGGRKFMKSLGTKNKVEALRRWPAALEDLERRANPEKPRPTDVLDVSHLDPTTGKQWEERERAIDLLPASAIDWSENEEDDGKISWTEAATIAEQRWKRKNGGEGYSRTWWEATRRAITFCPVGPEELQPRHIRQMIIEMEAAGMRPQSASQRCSCLSSLLTALIKSGAADHLTNPFSKVDYSVKSRIHYRTPSTQEYKAVWQRRHEMPEGCAEVLEILIFSGARIEEVLQARYSDGWMTMEKTPDWSPKNATSYRRLPLPEGMALSRFSTPSAQVFRKKMKRIAPAVEEAASMPLTPHCFRHGWRTAARMGGADDYLSERLLGHRAGLAMSMTYGEYPDELLQREAEKVWAVLRQWLDS